MDLFGFDPPVLDDTEIALIAHDRYGLAGTSRRLRGERSHNTMIATADGRPFVLKIASARDSWDTVDFHAQALIHLERTTPGLPVARMVPTTDGELVPVLERGDERHAMRMVTFLPGITFDEDTPVTHRGLFHIGALVGALSAALADFDHPAAHLPMPWDIANGLIVDPYLWDGLGPDAIALLATVRDRLEHVLETTRRLPQQVVHNDAHAGNLLRSDPASDVVSGVIDFGDLVHTAAAADLGVSGANLIPHQCDPAAGLGALVRGFHQHRPIDDDERAAIPELVLARLALSMLLTDYQIRHAPHIAHAVAAERPRLISNLERWSTLDPAHVADTLAEALR